MADEYEKPRRDQQALLQSVLTKRRHNTEKKESAAKKSTAEETTSPDTTSKNGGKKAQAPLVAAPVPAPVAAPRPQPVQTEPPPADPPFVASPASMLQADAWMQRPEAVCFELLSTLVSTPDGNDIHRIAPSIVWDTLVEASDSAARDEVAFMTKWAEIRERHTAMMREQGQAPSLREFVSELTAALREGVPCSHTLCAAAAQRVMRYMTETGRPIEGVLEVLKALRTVPSMKLAVVTDASDPERQQSIMRSAGLDPSMFDAVVLLSSGPEGAEALQQAFKDLGITAPSNVLMVASRSSAAAAAAKQLGVRSVLWGAAGATPATPTATPAPDAASASTSPPRRPPASDTPRKSLAWISTTTVLQQGPPTGTQRDQPSNVDFETLISTMDTVPQGGSSGGNASEAAFGLPQPQPDARMEARQQPSLRLDESQQRQARIQDGRREEVPVGLAGAVLPAGLPRSAPMVGQPFGSSFLDPPGPTRGATATAPPPTAVPPSSEWKDQERFMATKWQPTKGFTRRKMVELANEERLRKLLERCPTRLSVADVQAAIAAGGVGGSSAVVAALPAATAELRTYVEQAARAARIAPGDEVSVRSMVTSLNSLPKNLRSGSAGVVHSVDEDGDACIDFGPPDEKQWVSRYDLGCLSIIRSAREGQTAAAPQFGGASAALAPAGGAVPKSPAMTAPSGRLVLPPPREVSPASRPLLANDPGGMMPGASSSSTRLDALLREARGQSPVPAAKAAAMAGGGVPLAPPPRPLFGSSLAEDAARWRTPPRRDGFGSVLASPLLTATTMATSSAAKDPFLASPGAARPAAAPGQLGALLETTRGWDSPPGGASASTSALQGRGRPGTMASMLEEARRWDVGATTMMGQGGRS